MQPGVYLSSSADKDLTQILEELNRESTALRGSIQRLVVMMEAASASSRRSEAQVLLDRLEKLETERLPRLRDQMERVRDVRGQLMDSVKAVLMPARKRIKDLQSAAGLAQMGDSNGAAEMAQEIELWDQQFCIADPIVGARDEDGSSYDNTTPPRLTSLRSVASTSPSSKIIYRERRPTSYQTGTAAAEVNGRRSSVASVAPQDQQEEVLAAKNRKETSSEQPANPPSANPTPVRDSLHFAPVFVFLFIYKCKH